MSFLHSTHMSCSACKEVSLYLSKADFSQGMFPRPLKKAVIQLQLKKKKKTSAEKWAEKGGTWI